MKLIPLAPKGKERPRVTRNGTYMNSAYTAWKDAFELLHGAVEIDELICLTVIAIRPIPKSASKRKREQIRGQWAAPSPDLDNIVGAVMDAVYKANDNRIVQINAAKVWGDEAGILVDFSSAKEPPNVAWLIANCLEN